jgi:hypothetical protein
MMVSLPVFVVFGEIPNKVSGRRRRSYETT